MLSRCSLCDSADVLSDVPPSVTSPFDATTLVSSLNATDFLCVDIVLVISILDVFKFRVGRYHCVVEGRRTVTL